MEKGGGRDTLKEAANAMRVAELRDQLRSLGLSTSGLKQDLTLRLKNHYQQQTQQGQGSVQTMHGGTGLTHNRGGGRVAGAAKRGRNSIDIDSENIGIPLSGSSSSLPVKKIRSGVDQEKLRLEHSYCNYRDKSGEDCVAEDRIGPNGMVLLCEDLGVEPEDPVMIVLSFVMEATCLGYFSREEYSRGMHFLGCASPVEVRQRNKLGQLRSILSDPASNRFHQMYLFAYGWACEPNQKSISKETACGLWPLLFPASYFPRLSQFVEFVSNSSARGVTKDLWVQFYHFVKQYRENGCTFAGHDSENGAWPVIIDEFVDAVAKEDSGAKNDMMLDA